MDPKTLAQKQCVWASALTLTTICAQVATAIMATAPTNKVQWNEGETTALVNFLLVHKSEISDAGMFKMGMFKPHCGTSYFRSHKDWQNV
jgi:hypothetical protein